jgi:hypothetical protein
MRNNDQRENGYYGGGEVCGSGVFEEFEVMEKTELTQLQEGCLCREMLPWILLVSEIRQEASGFFHMMWMDCGSSKFQMKFPLHLFVLLFLFSKEDIKL